MTSTTSDAPLGMLLRTLEKTLATLDRKRLPAAVAKVLPTLCEGGFLDRGDNVLLFGLPGQGKSHVVCAIGHELIRRGHRVLPSATFVSRRSSPPQRHLRRCDSDSCGAPGYVELQIGRRHRLRAAEPRRDGGAVHLPRRALRAPQRDLSRHLDPRSGDPSRPAASSRTSTATKPPLAPVRSRRSPSSVTRQ